MKKGLAAAAVLLMAGCATQDDIKPVSERELDELPGDVGEAGRSGPG